MRYDVEDARRDHAGDLLARLLDALDLQTELVERGDDVGDRRVDRGEVADPGERCAHRAASVLRQEAQVAVEERLDLVDVVADHRDALETEAEREPGVL